MDDEGGHDPDDDEPTSSAPSDESADDRPDDESHDEDRDEDRGEDGPQDVQSDDVPDDESDEASEDESDGWYEDDEDVVTSEDWIGDHDRQDEGADDEAKATGDSDDTGEERDGGDTDEERDDGEMGTPDAGEDEDRDADQEAGEAEGEDESDEASDDESDDESEGEGLEGRPRRPDEAELDNGETDEYSHGRAGPKSVYHGTSEDDSSGAKRERDTAGSDSASSEDDGGSSEGGQTAGSGATGSTDTTSEGAPDDREMPLTEHIEEMVGRLLVVIAIMGAVAVVALFYSDEMINFLWYSFLDGPITDCPNASVADCPHVYHPLALILARLKVATLVGFIAALPAFVYETYLFMRPGLYPHERRYYLAAVPTSLVLATIGVGFAYFAVLPAMFNYFIGYSERAADLAFGLTETFGLIVLLLGFFALIFQIPLFIMLAIMMNVTSRQWLQDRRLYFWAGFAGIAFLFSPDPTGMAPVMVAVTMVVLFEGTLLLLRWTSASTTLVTAEELASARPYVWTLAALVGYLASAAPVPDGYFAYLPAAATNLLAGNGLLRATPVVIAAGLILTFELLAYVYRVLGRNVRVRLAIRRIRWVVWLAAPVIGYLGSPEPSLLALADRVALSPAQVLVVVAALLALYELTIVAMRRRRERPT